MKAWCPQAWTPAHTTEVVHLEEAEPVGGLQVPGVCPQRERWGTPPSFPPGSSAGDEVSGVALPRAPESNEAHPAQTETSKTVSQKKPFICMTDLRHSLYYRKLARVIHQADYPRYPGNQKTVFGAFYRSALKIKR